MISLFLCALCAIFSTAATCAFSGIITSWADAWIALLLLIAFSAASVAWTIADYFVISFVTMKKAKYPVYELNKFARWLVNDGVKFLGYVFSARFKVEGREKLPNPAQKSVFVINHRGLYDPLAMIGALDGYDLAFIAKKSLFKIPCINRVMCYSGFLPLDREDPKQAIRLFKCADHYLKTGQAHVCVFPEGTRNKTKDQTLLPFKAGALKVAYRGQCPLVVCTINNTDKLFKRARFLIPTRIYINIIKVYQYDEYKDIPSTELAEEIHKMMEESYIERSKRRV